MAVKGIAVNSLTSGDFREKRKRPKTLGTHCKPLLCVIAYYFGSFSFSLPRRTKGFFYPDSTCIYMYLGYSAGKKCAEFFLKS
jgi:hypothetical protein